MSTTAMRQATLVAFYGKQPAGLARLLEECRGLMARLLGEAFVPYDPAQIHATILGLARLPGAPLRNRSFAELRREEHEMDLAGLRDWLLGSPRLPFLLRFGGFDEGSCPFTSRGASPFERSFSIQGDKVVLIGWPCAPDGFTWPDSLDRLRREAQRFGVLHRYHPGPDDVDNDAYLRIGLLREALPEVLARDAEEFGRQLLADSAPAFAELGEDALSFAVYEEETLPPQTTRAWPLATPCIDEVRNALA